MKRAKDGWPMKRVKTAMGHVIWVRMTEDELFARDVFRLVSVLVPMLLFFAFVCASGVLW